MKKVLTLSVTFLIILTVAIIFNQSRTTTYGEVIDNLLLEDEEINEIYILYIDRKDNEEKEMTIKNKEEIKRLTVKPNIKLKKTNKYNGTIYFMTIKTNKTSFSLNIDDNNNLYVDGKEYKISGNNELIDILKSYEKKWEPIE